MRRRDPYELVHPTLLTEKALREYVTRVLGPLSNVRTAPNDDTRAAVPNELLDCARHLLECLAFFPDSRRKPRWLREAALLSSYCLLLVELRWRAGDVLTLDEALDFKRPRYWNRAGERTNGRLFSACIRVLALRRDENYGIKDAVAVVAPKFAVSESALEKAWYRSRFPKLLDEQRAEPRFRRRSQKNAKKSEKPNTRK